MENIENILENLYSYFNVTNATELSEKINESQQTISNWKRRNSISAVKKKCRELGIYEEIFGDSLMSFNQFGTNTTQIRTQHNNTGTTVNNSSSNITPSNSYNLDEDLIPLFEALCSVSRALNKKDVLKEELTNLIAKLPSL